MPEVWYDNYLDYGDNWGTQYVGTQYMVVENNNYFANCTFTTATTALTYVNTATTTPIYRSVGQYDWTSIRMANGPGSMNNRLWKQWNADYVKDKDEARRLAVLEDERRQVAAHARVLQVCVTGATGQGQRLEAFAITRLVEYNDDEWRTVEDAYQRAYEGRVEADRAATRILAEKAEAQRKAELLLVSILTAAQKREWLQHKRVTHVSKSGRTWRLFPLWSGGLVLMGEGEVRRATFCVHASGWIPEADNMVALLLSLRHGEEDRLIAIGNLHAGELTEDELQIRRNYRVPQQPFVPRVPRIAGAHVERVYADEVDFEDGDARNRLLG